MQKLILITIIFLFILTGKTYADVSKISADKINSALKIDGVLNEAEWEKAGEYKIKYNFNGTSTNIKTKFKLLYDEFAIYLGIICEEPQMEKLKGHAKERDGGVWNDDSVEIFLNLLRDRESYAHFIINSSGIIYDAKNRGREVETAWNAQGIEVGVIKQNMYWALEIKIPIAALYSIYENNADKEKITGDSWSMNIGRNRLAGGKRELSTFARLMDFNELTSYSQIDSMQYDSKKFLWDIYNFTLGEITPISDGYNLGIGFSVVNRTGKLRVVSLTGNLSKTAKAIEPEKIAIDDRQVYQWKKGISISKQGKYDLALSLSDSHNNLLAAKYFAFEASYNPLSLEIIEPHYRNAIYATMDIKRIRLRLNSNQTISDNPICRVNIFSKEKGKSVAERQFKLEELKNKEFDLAIPHLEPGLWICRVKVMGKNDLTAETELNVYPPATTEIRVNERNNLVINGKERMLIGAFHYYWTDKGLEEGENIDFSLSYTPLYDLKKAPAKKEALLKDARMGRYRIIYPETEELWSHIFSNSYLARKPLPEENARKIASRLKQYNGIPSILAWYLADEPIPSRHLPGYLEQLSEVVRKNDPYRPCFISFNNGNSVKTYEKAFDICGMHMFPGFNNKGISKPLSTFGEHTRMAVQLAGKHKPVYAGIPLTPYSPGGISRMPTFMEIRCLVYLGIINGAKGIFWNTAVDISADIENRLGVPAIIRELRSLESAVLSSETCEIRVDGNVQVLGKIVDGHLYIFSVNPEMTSNEVILKIPSRWLKLRELAANDEEYTISNGELLLKYKPFEVKLFSSAPNLQSLESVNSIYRRFAEARGKFENSGNVLYFTRGTKIKYSDHFNNITSTLDKVLIDGYKEQYPRFRRKFPGNAWIELTLPTRELISRLEISWQTGSVNFIPQVKLFIDGKELAADIKIESSERNIHTSKFLFKPMATNQIKIIVPGDSRSPVPSEIQAFKD